MPACLPAVLKRLDPNLAQPDQNQLLHDKTIRQTDGFCFLFTFAECYQGYGY
jgi:hypothetical protein